MTRGSKNRAEVINEGRCNGIDWSMEVKETSGERRRVSDNESQNQIMTYSYTREGRRFQTPTRSGFTILPNI